MQGTAAIGEAATRPWSVFAVLAIGTATGIAGIEMILPILPTLPGALSGTPQQAQLILASYVAGGAVGTACFGELGARFDGRRLLAASLLAYAILAFCSAVSVDLTMLSLVRLMQGAAGAATLVFSPGMIQASFPGPRGIQAMGRLGTVGAIAALATPPLGQFVGDALGWRVVVALPGLGALVAGLALMRLGQGLPRFVPTGRGGLARLLRRPGFLGLAVNQALARAALLTFAFGLPSLLNGRHVIGMSDFVVLRVVGVAVYVLSALAGWRVALRLGPRPTMVAATALSACAACVLAGIVAGLDAKLAALVLAWAAVNVGQGLREPIVQLHLVERSMGDPARAIAVTTVIGMVATSILTALLGSFLPFGLTPLGISSALIWVVAFGVLVLAGRRM